MRPAVYIPNFNGGARLGRTLESLRAQTRPADVVVVDNGSSDGSVELVRGEFPEATALALGENLGFGPAINRAVAAHPADLVILLNNDATPEPRFVEALLERAEGAEMVAGVLLQERDPALIDSAGSSQLLYLLVTSTYSARIAGFIFLAERVVARPLSMVGTSILQVFMGEAGRTAHEDPPRLKKRFYQVVNRQFWLALTWIAVANLMAALLFPKVFGAEWGDAVVYLQAMSVGYLAQAIVLPVFHTLQILEKQALAAIWQIGRLTLVTTTFVLARKYDIPATVTVFSYSAVQAVACVVLLLLMMVSIQKLQKATP